MGEREKCFSNETISLIVLLFPANLILYIHGHVVHPHFVDTVSVQRTYIHTFVVILLICACQRIKLGLVVGVFLSKNSSLFCIKGKG